MNNSSPANTVFRSAKSRSQGRLGWCILFRHPLYRDMRNRSVRVRKGLSTRDESEADMLVSQMNRLLQDESYWTKSSRERASQEFDPRVVAIFYDFGEATAANSRNEQPGKVIPLRF